MPPPSPRPHGPISLSLAAVLGLAGCTPHPPPVEEPPQHAVQEPPQPVEPAPEPVDAGPDATDAAADAGAQPVAAACTGEPQPIPESVGHGCRGRQRAVNLRQLFRDVHDSPRGSMRPSRVAGIQIAETYDESQAAEDPLVPRCWLVAAGRHFDYPDAVGEALAAACFAADSPEAALAAAALSFDCDRSSRTRILREPGREVDLPDNVPANVAARVCPPRVARQGDGYEVTLDVHRVSWVARFHHMRPVPESIERVTVRVGPGRYEIDSEPLWSVP